MFQTYFINKNLKKFFLNFKIKKFYLNIKLFRNLFRIKKKIILKINNIYKNKFLKNKNKKKKILITNIYLKYFKKINKNFKILILKNPNIVHNIVLKKNKILKIKNFINKKYKYLKKKEKKFNFKISNLTSGKGFCYINPPLSIFYENIKNYILNIHIKEHNYKYIIVPNILNFKSLINSGQIPKFIKKLFVLKIKKKIKYLIPTSEVCLINFMLKKKINSKFIPIKLVSTTECYRNEKICYGNNNKSIIKQKQFSKIELVQFINNKNSNKYLIELIKNVEKIIKLFKIDYRIIKLSKSFLSYISKITFDFEIWMPEINNYCEVSSCSDTGVYQSTRSNIKYKKNKKIEYFSIINGSGLAIGRFFLSILLNNKLENGSFIIPKNLKILKKNKFLII